MSGTVLISHDVDHLSSFEHTRDLIVPKFIARSAIELASGVVGAEESAQRLWDCAVGRWNFVREIADFDREHGIQSTFFFAVRQGLGISYQPVKAKSLVDYVRRRGHEVGLHAIARESTNALVAEKAEFESVYDCSCTGVRLHYLYPDGSVLPRIEEAGFAYDSSLRGEGSMKVVGTLSHFPVHIMDVDVFNLGRSWQTVHVDDAIRETKNRVATLLDSGVDFVSLLFHDRYFSRGHRAWMHWYCTILGWLRTQGIPTCTYSQALKG